MGKIIQLNQIDGEKYRSFLDTYRNRIGKEPGPVERTEAFFCARSKNPFDMPWWCYAT